MPGWDHFAEVTGGAAGALVGLLFVAVSIHAEKIVRSDEVRYRAAQALVVFAIILLTAVLLVVPSQSARALGAELIAVALVFYAVLAILERRAKSGDRGKIGQLLKRVNANIVTGGGPALTGALLLAGISWAMFVLVATTCFAFVSGMASAWFLLTKVVD